MREGGRSLEVVGGKRGFRGARVGRGGGRLMERREDEG